MNPEIEEKQRRFVLSKNIGLELIEGDRNKLERINKTALYVYNLYYSYYFLSCLRFQYLSAPFTGKRARNIEEAVAPFRAESRAIWEETELVKKIDEVILRDLPEDLNTEEFLKPIRNAIAKSFDFEKHGVRFEKYPSSLQKKSVPLFFDVTPDNIHSFFSIVTNPEIGSLNRRHKNAAKTIKLTAFGCRFRVKLSRAGSKAHDILLHMLEVGAEEYGILSSAIRLTGKDKIALILNYEQIGRFTSVSHPDQSIVLGIDLGINYPAYGMIYPNKIGRPFGSKDEYFDKKRQFRHRKEILSQLTHNSTVQEIKLREAVQNFRTGYNHQLSREIIKYAQQYNVGIIHLEKLSFGTNRKNKHFLLRDWDYAQLRDFITYKAKQVGITVKMVNARYTSVNCSENNAHQKGRNMALQQVNGKRLDNVFLCTHSACKNHFHLIGNKRAVSEEKCTACNCRKTVFKLTESRRKDGSSKTWYVQVCRNDRLKGEEGVFLKCKNFYHFCRRDENAALNIAKGPVQAKMKKKQKRNGKKD